MGIVCFEGDPPYELLLAKRGRAKAEGEIVRLVLPVSVPGPEPQEREIQILLRFGHAHGLATDLRQGAIDARKAARSNEDEGEDE